MLPRLTLLVVVEQTSHRYPSDCRQRHTATEPTVHWPNLVCLTLNQTMLRLPIRLSLHSSPNSHAEPSLPTQRRAPPAVPPAQSKPCALAQAAPAPARKMPNKPLPPPVASSQSSPSAGAVTATPSPGHGLRPSPFPQLAAKPLPPVEVSKEKEAASERQNSFEGINTTISFVLLSQVIFTSEVDRYRCSLSSNHLHLACVCSF